MKAVLATPIGKIVLGEYDLKCPKAPIDETNVRSQGRHEKVLLGVMDWDDVDHYKKYVCDHCGEEFEFSSGNTKFDTPSGYLEPGCLYWETSLPESYYWDNHKGAHLMAILPNGMPWNIDSRASNCGSPNDRLHRCWVRHGEPPNIHVDKNGLTCNAGAGSIDSNRGTPDHWHGYLHNGEFHT